ncbi:MAG: SIMPL domain-containing protein [Gammaproteobacteria bacterium]|nr:SIMPL domain-containing protein [Gammaproteobacteria bacterium]
MREQSSQGPAAAMVLGVLLAVGLALLGYQLADGLMRFRATERTVTVKGLAEREVAADIAIWPIRFSVAGDDLEPLYASLERQGDLVIGFLRNAGFAADEITLSPPAIVDRRAQAYGNPGPQDLRYAGSVSVTVYTKEVERVRQAMRGLTDLGKQGIAIAGQDYGVRTEFLYTDLNDIKPAMIEEATRNAREVATKFAQDSSSRLGKIRAASQGLFTIQDRDSNTPYIKKVRVVSTVEYYLVD